MSQHYALSTVAMTLYNYLQDGRMPMSPAGLVAMPAVQEMHAIDETCAVAALDELVKRGYLIRASGRYMSRDPQFRKVVDRDTSDAGVDKKGGITGGWGHWRVMSGNRAVNLQEALR